MKGRRDTLMGIAGGCLLGMVFCFVLGADKPGPDKAPASVTPHYSVQFTPTALVITDNEKNKLYIYGKKEGSEETNSLYRTIDLTEAGKSEITAIKPADEQK